MKRGTKHLVLILVLVSMIFVPMKAHASPKSQETSLTATLSIVTRGVQLMKSGTKRWLNITIDSVLEVGDRVRTDDSGVALITWFENGTTMELAPETEIVVEQLTGDEDQFTIEITLIKGSVFNNTKAVTNEDSIYSFQTPSLMVTGRASIFGVYVDEEFNSAVAVTIGAVNVLAYQNLDEEIELEEGNLISSDLEGTLSDPDALDSAADEFEAFSEAMVDYDTRVTEAEAEADAESED